MDIAGAEKQLRRYDKALRLRTNGDWVNVERKTFRGVVGCLDSEGQDWKDRDSGRRREEGHVLILTIHRDEFDASRLLDVLKSTDSWQGDVPLWRKAEIRDEANAARKKRLRQDIIRYKASEAFDRYAWKYKQRVNVPTSIV
jgi:hypothetical protein